MSKTLALDFGCVLRTTSALGFFPAVLPAQQVLAGGANLFAPSPHVGRELGAARALPVTSCCATEGLKANADPGTLVRSEPATEYALPPGVTAVRILYHTRTAGNVDGLAVTTTSCLANPRAERFCTGFARPVRAFSEMSIRDLETIPWYMGPCETSWIVSLPGLLESRHQAIVRRHRLSKVAMALERKRDRQLLPRW